MSGFHPPDISIELMKNGQVIPNAQQTDLAFEKGWQFHLTKSVSFTPEKSDEYSCSVRHMDTTKKIVWGECYVCISRRYHVVYKTWHVYWTSYVFLQSPTCKANKSRERVVSVTLFIINEKYSNTYFFYH